MVLLAAVADSAERAVENNVMVLDNTSTSTVKGELFLSMYSPLENKVSIDKINSCRLAWHLTNMTHFEQVLI